LGNYISIKISAKESLGYYVLKKHKPWFDERYSKLLDPRKHAKIQWLQDPNQAIGDNLNSLRHEASSNFGNIKHKNLKENS
jgi:hypothetical protein